MTLNPKQLEGLVGVIAEEFDLSMGKVVKILSEKKKK
jgi:hypothetical protein